MHKLVSIHAPAWGATAAQACGCKEVRVSIHAPAWGATTSKRYGLGIPVEFQSTRPRGARLTFNNWVSQVIMFQSTRPRGARRCSGLPLRPPESFNPRARVGRDGRPRIKNELSFGFNPRARVGRDEELALNFLDEVFQSTRPRGARRDDCVCCTH